MIRIQFFCVVWAFSLWYIGWNLLIACLMRFPLSTPVLHLTGVAVGLMMGFLFLQQRWVDCEKYDLLTLWSGRRRSPLKQLQGIWKSARSTLRQKPKRSKQRVTRPKIIYLHEQNSRD